MSQDDIAITWKRWVAEAKSTSMEAIAKSRDLLREPAPNTFLGRKHYEIILLPDERE